MTMMATRAREQASPEKPIGRRTRKRGPERPVEHVGVAGIAEWFGVDSQTVSTWLIRYDGTPTPTPVPDVTIVPGRRGAPDRGWLPERRAEWEAWHKSRPGLGGPGIPRGPRRKAGDDDSATE